MALHLGDIYAESNYSESVSPTQESRTSDYSTNAENSEETQSNESTSVDEESGQSTIQSEICVPGMVQDSNEGEVKIEVPTVVITDADEDDDGDPRIKKLSNVMGCCVCFVDLLHRGYELFLKAQEFLQCLCAVLGGGGG